jgi:hypothetical protein
LESESDYAVSRSGRRVYRTNDARLVIALYSLFGLGSIAAALFPGPQQGFCIGTAVFFVIWAAWVWQYGVHATSRGVTIATILRFVRVPWSDIARFEMVPLSDVRSGFAVVKRGERTMVLSSALCTPLRPEAKVEHYRREIQAVVDELNQVLAEHSASSVTVESQLSS